MLVTVLHGTDVELADNFIVEGVWEGDFNLGNFHCAEHFFGSGIVVQDDCVWIVPSTALVDRLFFCEDNDYFFASNSLVCLLAYLGAELDSTHNYKEQSDSILVGINGYKSTFPILHETIKSFEQILYFPIKLTKHGFESQRFDTQNNFNDYSEYYSSLRKNLKDIRVNSKSPQRKKPLLAYTTVSRGYDSTAVTALTHDLDIRKAFTSRKSSSAFASWMNPDAAIDDGTCIAKTFDLQVSYLDYSQKDIGEDETVFICPTPAEPEIIFYKACRELGNNSVPSILFTGYHGDKIWNRNLNSKNLERDIVRGDNSGLNLGEARLNAAFINIPVPLMYAKDIASIQAISNSDDMLPWSIGDYYDRPIPRRIAEDAGILRATFGNRKKSVISFYNMPKNKSLRKKFYKSLKEDYKIGKFRCITTSYFDALTFYSEKGFKLIGAFLGVRSKVPLTKNSLDIPYKMFLWALKCEVKHKKNTLKNGWKNYKKVNEKSR